MVERAFLDIGDRLTRALLSGDFGLYRDLIALPLTITPRGAAPYVIGDEDELRREFDLYHAVLRTNSVTDIFREVKDVTQPEPGSAVVRVTTHILQRANRVADPFETRFFMRDQDGVWRITAIESAPPHVRWLLGQSVHGFDWI